MLLHVLSSRHLPKDEAKKLAESMGGYLSNGASVSLASCDFDEQPDLWTVTVEIDVDVVLQRIQISQSLEKIPLLDQGFFSPID